MTEYARLAKVRSPRRLGGDTTGTPSRITPIDDAGDVALWNSVGVYADPTSSNVYVSEANGQAVYLLNTSTSEISDFAGSGIPGFDGDGGSAVAATAEVNGPSGISKDSSGNIYIADQNNCAIREVEASTGDISTIAGGSNGHLNGCGYGGDGGSAVDSQLNAPADVTVDASGNLYIADTNNCAIRKIDGSSHIISTIAGALGCAYSGDDGPAKNAQLRQVQSVALDAAGNLYIGDQYNQRIREIVAQTGNIITVAGNGVAGYNGDGVAAGIEFNYPCCATSDPNGNLFVSDESNQILRWITPTGQTITFAGTVPGSSTPSNGFSGDGGPALKAQFYQPTRLSQDSQGNIYVADQVNNRVRRVTAFAGFGISAANLTFGTQPAGTTSDFQPITVSAIGPITISGVSTTAGFSEIDDCSGTALAVWHTCEIDVYFQPTAAGKASGTLTITAPTFFPKQPNTVALTGTARDSPSAARSHSESSPSKLP